MILVLIAGSGDLLLGALCVPSLRLAGGGICVGLLVVRVVDVARGLFHRTLSGILELLLDGLGSLLERGIGGLVLLDLGREFGEALRDLHRLRGGIALSIGKTLGLHFVGLVEEGLALGQLPKRIGFHAIAQLALVQFLQLSVDVFQLSLDSGVELLLADDGDAELAAGDPVMLAAVEIEVVLHLDEVFEHFAGLEIGIGELCQIPVVIEFIPPTIDGATGFAPGNFAVIRGDFAFLDQVDDPFVAIGGRLG